MALEPCRGVEVPAAVRGDASLENLFDEWRRRLLRRFFVGGIVRDARDFSDPIQIS